MKRNRRRLPVPQHEFGFTPDTFNLIQETGVDGDRIARERDEADRARRRAEAAQVVVIPLILGGRATAVPKPIQNYLAIYFEWQRFYSINR